MKKASQNQSLVWCGKAAAFSAADALAAVNAIVSLKDSIGC